MEDTGHRNAMHGFWMAMARLASQQWWRPGWWPYWDGGMPFEYTYAPLVPGLTALWSKIAGVSIGRAFHSVAGFIYVFTPVSLFAMGVVVFKRVGWSFVAGWYIPCSRPRSSSLLMKRLHGLMLAMPAVCISRPYGTKRPTC